MWFPIFPFFFIVLGITLMPPDATSNVQFPDNDSNGKIKLPGLVLKLAKKTPSNNGMFEATLVIWVLEHVGTSTSTRALEYIHRHML